MGQYLEKILTPKEVFELSPPSRAQCIVFKNYDWQDSHKGLHDLMVKMGFVQAKKKPKNPQYTHSSLAVEIKFEFSSSGFSIEKIELNSVVKIDRGFNEDIFQLYLKKQPATVDFSMYCEMDQEQKIMLTAAGERLRQLRCMVVGDVDTPNDEMVATLFKAISLNQCMGEILTQSMVHGEKKDTYTLENSQLFSSTTGLEETHLGLESLLNFDNSRQASLFDYMAPSLRYINEVLSVERLEESLRAWNNLEVNGVLPPRKTWFPVSGADGLPHVLLHMARSQFNLLDAFFECLEQAEPEEVREWMSPSKKHATHIPLMFIRHFAKEELIHKFFNIVDKKIRREEICWEHDHESLLALMLDSNRFSSKWTQQSVSEAWKAISLIDPNYQCLFTSKTTLPFKSSENYLTETVLTGGGLKIEKQSVPDCYVTIQKLPQNYDRCCWAFHPISNFEELKLFFDELIFENSKESGNTPCSFSLELASYSSSFVLEHRLKNHFLKNEMKNNILSNVGLNHVKMNRFQ